MLKLHEEIIRQIENDFPELTGLIHEEETAGVLMVFDLCVSMKDLLPVLYLYKAKIISNAKTL